MGVFLIATLTDHCCQLMVRCKYYAIEQIIERASMRGDMSVKDLDDMRHRLGKTLSYGDIGRTVFGDWCYHLIQFAVWFTQFTTCMCYFIFIGNTVYKMYPQTPVLTDLKNTTINISLSAQTLVQNQSYAVPMLNIVTLGKRAVTHNEFRGHMAPAQAEFVNTSSLSSQSAHVLMYSNDSLLYQSALSQSHNGAANVYNSNLTTTVDPNATTIDPNTTTINPNITTTRPPLPTEAPYPQIPTTTTAPDLKYVVMFPLAFFIVTSLIRKMRLIAPFSAIATIALGVGALSVFGKICAGE